MDQHTKFKHLLEYFVSHLEFCVTKNTKNTRYNQYIKPIKNFKRGGQGHNSHSIQNQIKDWEGYDLGTICININPTVYTKQGCYLNWLSTSINVIAVWNNSADEILSLKIVKDSYPVSNAKDILKLTISELGLFDNKVPNLYLISFFETFENELIHYLKLENKKAQMEKISPYTQILKANKNIILTGAPGTGKTYLAKQIAKQIIGVDSDEELANSGQFGFVQFHPSYDYTDFVEGLRPTKPDANGNIGFELKNGVFKEFCKRALGEEINSNFDVLYNQFINDVTEESLELKTPTHKKDFKVEINSNQSCIAIPKTEIGTKMSITKEMIYDYIHFDKIRDWKPYTIPIANYFIENYNYKPTSNNQDKNYIFVIDEINRGEISKIFGELFFSIDPSYRGIKGAVKTQYANMHDDTNETFYIPENVYIIGSMNDIDRSVESFDFAMRRRFTWIEITAQESASNMNLPQEILNKMNSINDKISTIDVLGSAFHIGGAYFLDANGKPRTDLDKVYEFRIEPLLKEYLRGLPDSKKIVETLKVSYFSDENNG